MNRKYSWPDSHWNWPVRLTHQHGVRAGNYIFTGGQADLDANGNVRHADDVERQVASVTSYMLDVLVDLGAEASDLVRLVVYFVGDAITEQAILNQIGNIIGSDVMPVVNTIPVPELCYPGMVIELEGVAMIDATGGTLKRKNIRLNTLPQLPGAFSHVVQCGDVVFTSDMSAVDANGLVSEPGDVIRQTTIMMDQLAVALQAAAVGFDDVLKLNVFYVGDGTAENWEQPALIRQACFNDPGPAATGITLPAFAIPGLMTKIAVTAMQSDSVLPEVVRAETNNPGIADKHKGNSLTRKYSWPDGHWDWTTRLPYKHGNLCGSLIHLGGQVSLDSNAQVLDADDIVAQTQRAIENIEKVLAELGANLDHVVKVTTFYQGTASAEALHKNLLVRSNAFSSPGPATSGIPVPSLVYENMLVEIEVIAVLDS